MASVVTDILDSLAELGFPEACQSAEQLKSIVEKGPKSSEFVDLVVRLSHELRKFYSLEEEIHSISGPDDSASFFLELNGFLRELNCPYLEATEGSASQKFASADAKLQIIDYLCTELQAARMLAVNMPTGSSTPSSPPVQMRDVEAANALKLMLMSLGFPKPPEGITSKILFAKALERLKEQLKVVPGDNLGKPLFTGYLSEEQWKTLKQLNEDMKLEYRDRSSLLLKRLDVTTQSFAWSDKGKQKESELEQIYRPKREKLKAESHVTLVDLLAARDDLTVFEKTSSSKVRANTATPLNKVLMGRVADRGGRPTDMHAPAPEMPSWQKRSAGDGAARGRGGGRVQGGWSGGGGGRGSMNFNSQVPSGGDQQFGGDGSGQPQRQEYRRGGGKGRGRY